jgi:hypothetical protein
MSKIDKTYYQLLNKIISEMKPNWFKLNNYNSYPHIKVEMLERDE